MSREAEKLPESQRERQRLGGLGGLWASCKKEKKSTLESEQCRGRREQTVTDCVSSSRRGSSSSLQPLPMQFCRSQLVARPCWRPGDITEVPFSPKLGSLAPLGKCEAVHWRFSLKKKKKNCTHSEMKTL